LTRDRDIRALLHAALDRRLPPGAVVIDEYGGVTGSVVDVAAFTPNALHSFEIKSDVDSTRRLPDQVRGYSLIATTATVVAGFRTAAACARIVPEWWGVIAAWEGGLEIVRDPLPNPEQDKTWIAAILWGEEARREAIARGLGRPRRGWKAKMALAEALTVDELREAVHRHVRARQWSFDRTPPRVIGVEAVAA
jgi:hypothetical protein